jgi:ATP-binding cassette subfamily C protein LapB
MLLIDLPFLLLSFALIAVIALPLLPVVFLTMTAFVALAWYSGRSARENNEREKERVINRDIAIAELSGARLALKALGASEAASVRWESHYALWMRESMLRSQESDRYRDMANELTTLNMVMTTTFGALAILSQLMSLGALIAANILAGKLVAPLVQLVGQWRSWGQFLAAKRRIDALMVIDLEREYTDVTLPRPKGVLRMEEVEFSYPESSAPQIHQVSGQIGPNGLHAIVGSNGSGKTTLLKLLRGLYVPSKGRIVLDGADLKQFSQKDLSRWIGYLPQQIHLVSGTVRDNLTLSSLDASDEQIVRATTLACAHGFLVDLPDGYGTQVGEGGMRFSGGQRKRIAIAQVLLHDPAILLLDEPTSDLDRDAEQAFIGTLRELARDHTVIVVTHSPAILAHCNGLIVMDKGRIVAAGPASQLLPSLGMTARTEEAPRAA